MISGMHPLHGLGWHGEPSCNCNVAQQPYPLCQLLRAQGPGKDFWLICCRICKHAELICQENENGSSLFCPVPTQLHPSEGMGRGGHVPRRGPHLSPCPMCCLSLLHPSEDPSPSTVCPCCFQKLGCEVSRLRARDLQKRKLEAKLIQSLAGMSLPQRKSFFLSLPVRQSSSFRPLCFKNQLSSVLCKERICRQKKKPG